VLDEVASSDLPYPRKAELGLAAAEEAVRELARNPASRTRIQRHLCVDGSRVLLSPFGLRAAGTTTGPLAVELDGSAVRVVPVAAGEDVAAVVRRLADRHGWQLPPGRVDRLRARDTLPGFHGLGRFEFHALLNSSPGRAVAASAPQLADVVYPLWRPRALGLTLTYRCTASCGHCYNASSPRRSADCLGWSETGDDLGEWVRLGVDDIGLSGGEPFLYPDLLVEMVGRLRALGVRLISPFTNGFWGADVAAARDLLTRLRAVGFGDVEKDQIKISAGEFHAPYVAAEAVLTVAELHHEIIGNPVVMDVAFVRSDEQLRQLVGAARQRGVHDRIQWMARPAVSDSGRARPWYADLPHNDRPLAELRCPVTSSASLYPAGEWVYCSGTSWPVTYRRVGELGQDDPYGILARTQRDPRVPYWQFGTFADWLRDHPRPGFHGDTVRMPERSTPCGVCRDLFAPPPAHPPRRARA
jgi:pyruvate-formate lyase-activating enzyme